MTAGTARYRLSETAAENRPRLVADNRGLRGVVSEDCTELNQRMAHRSDRRGADPCVHLAFQVVVAIGTPRASFP